MGLGDVVITEPGEAAQVRGRPKVLASALEALIGAVFKEQGIAGATSFIEKHILSRSKTSLREKLKRTPVQRLTYKLRENNLPYPKFREKDNDQRPLLSHSTEYIMEALCGHTVIGIGVGPSKRKATSLAAEDAIEKGSWRQLRGQQEIAAKAFEVGEKAI